MKTCIGKLSSFIRSKSKTKPSWILCYNTMKRQLKLFSNNIWHLFVLGQSTVWVNSPPPSHKYFGVCNHGSTYSPRNPYISPIAKFQRPIRPNHGVSVPPLPQYFILKWFENAAFWILIQLLDTYGYDGYFTQQLTLYLDNVNFKLPLHIC